MVTQFPKQHLPRPIMDKKGLKRRKRWEKISPNDAIFEQRKRECSRRLHLFLLSKKDHSQRPATIKELRQFIPYHHFKLKELKKCLKNLVKLPDQVDAGLLVRPCSEVYVSWQPDPHIWRLMSFCWIERTCDHTPSLPSL